MTNRTNTTTVSFEKYTDFRSSCPACEEKGLDIFYDITNVPVNSCLIMPSKAEAEQFPTGQVRLGFCNRCGFITNTRYSTALQEYSARYEETQGFSACFNSFARSLAQKLVDKYEMRGKTILEIGCGKGEFLALLCRYGGNRGIGIDPAYVPQRNPDKNLRIEFIQDFYDERYSNINADVICCRHTLEHIGPTGKFIRSIRRTIGDRTNTLVIFELPDVLRVLKEGAFWDIYYEHCSYFAPQSLLRLFRAEGFEVTELYLDYDEQYIILTAYPTTSGTDKTEFAGTADVDELRTRVDSFGSICSKRIDSLRSITESILKRGQTAALWGSGSKGVAFLTSLGMTNHFEYVIDINPYRQGKFMPGTGHIIVSPEYLKEHRPEKIIVMNPIYMNEISQKLDSLGIKAQLLPIV